MFVFLDPGPNYQLELFYLRSQPFLSPIFFNIEPPKIKQQSIKTMKYFRFSVDKIYFPTYVSVENKMVNL